MPTTAIHSRVLHFQREALDGRLPRPRVQMPIALPHGFGLVAHPLIDYPLINAERRQVTRKTVPVRVEANLVVVAFFAQAPDRIGHRLPEGAVRSILGDSFQGLRVADHKLALPLPLTQCVQLLFQFRM